MKEQRDPAFFIGLRIGAIGGIVAVLTALVGMLQTFSARFVVGGLVSMSHTVILLVLFGTGYVAARRGASERRSSAIIAGAVAGLVASTFIITLVWLGSTINLGPVFINSTPQLYDILTFGLGSVVGSLALWGIGAVLGAIAGLLLQLPPRIRRPITAAVVAAVTLGILRDLIIIALGTLPFIAGITGFLYAPNGLSGWGAVTVLIVTAGLVFLWSERGTAVKNRIAVLPPTGRRTLRWSAIVVAVAFLLLLPVIFGLYMSEVLDMVGIYLLMGLGLNIVVGFAGLLDLGYVAFFAIGAYTAGVLTSPELGHAAIMTNWWAALPFAVVVAVFCGIVLGIPVLNMRGDYLAIVTLGFGEIIRLLAQSDLLKKYFGGAQGTRIIAKPNIGPLQIDWGPQAFYYIILAGCLLAIFIAPRLKNSRLGRAWMAVREDEDVAQAVGINLVATKLMAFAMGAFFGGLSGAIFASKLGSIFPTSFSFIISINVLALIIIGGMGSIPGVVLGAVVMVGLPELLREFAEYRMLFYGAALVLMMLVRPEGIVPEARRKLELHEAEPLGVTGATELRAPPVEAEATSVGSGS